MVYLTNHNRAIREFRVSICVHFNKGDDLKVERMIRARDTVSRRDVLK